MPLKKIDSRIRTLIENSVALNHRCLFVMVGDRGRDQVVILHHMMCNAVVKKGRPSVLWCYKKELEFSSHRKKRMRQLQKKMKSGTLNVSEDDPFELFIASTNIRFCYYADTHKILGNTYGMCVLQDFEALTPNLLARTVETVEGGGIAVLLLRTMTSLKQLYTMSMDVHARYRTESHKHVTARFNERFLLSLADCQQCMVVDDQLTLLPLSSHMLSISKLPRKAENKENGMSELQALKDSLLDTQPVGHLVGCCKTLDQAKALLKFVEAISEQTLRSTVAVTASRGRGKSAALGLAVAAAVAFGYSNIFVTSPSPENLGTFFDFVLKGFDSVDYKEHEHYEIVQSTNPEFNRALVRINIFHQHRQTIQYIRPSDAHKLEQAELVCIDEAAAIPLPMVKELLGPYLVFMASTINGYEGTGRSLSLKLLEDLRSQSARGGASGRVLKEISLDEPIRYGADDSVEKWLHQLLCLDADLPRVLGGCPNPSDCNLYYVNRDTLFCYHKASEVFLQQLMALYVSSHYKNSPNDLQLLSDAPAHHVFVLLGPISPDTTSIPDILCVLQICLEGAISRSSVVSSLSRGKRASGDLIPWTLSQQFADHDFAGLSGARIVRIATHPEFQRMGYGTRALHCLIEYYSDKMTSVLPDANATVQEQQKLDAGQNESMGLLHDVIAPRTLLPPLLCQLSERKPEALDYVGVSFGLTLDLLRFWSRNKFTPVYLRQTANDLTGEHSCIMLRQLVDHPSEDDWLPLYSKDFRRRYLSLLGYQFRSFPPKLALGLLQQVDAKGHLSLNCSNGEAVTHEVMTTVLSKYDLKRLDLYARNMADYHLITDLLPPISRLCFTREVGFKLTELPATILLSLGLQHKTIDVLQGELGLGASQLLGLFNRVMHKFLKLFKSLEESVAAGEIANSTNSSNLDLCPITQSIDKELSEEAKVFEKKQSKERSELLNSPALAQYTVSGQEEDWVDISGGREPGIVSIKSKKSLKRGNDQQATASDSKTHKKTKTHKRTKKNR